MHVCARVCVLTCAARVREDVPEFDEVVVAARGEHEVKLTRDGGVSRT